MFGFFRSKDKSETDLYAVKKEVHAKLDEAALKVIAALNTEMDYLMFFKGKQKRDFLADTYFVRYLFGMLDAVTTLRGPELRLKIAKRFLALHYLRFLVLEFEFEQAVALRVFHTVWKLYSSEKDQRDDAILDGGFDGVGVLRGENPQRLMKHFGVDADNDTTLLRQSLPKPLLNCRSGKHFGVVTAGRKTPFGKVRG